MLDPLRPDSEWLGAWITGRALARGLPMPFRDRGGWRAEVGSDSETRRWLFDGLTDELIVLAAEIREPGQNLRVLCESDALQAALPAGWQVGAPSYAMFASASATSDTLPAGFKLECRVGRQSAHAAILTEDGVLAASGHVGIGEQAFVYDRIVTHASFRRLGLGTGIMHALAGAMPDPQMPQLLVATEIGRKLYEALGWKVVSPYASAGFVA